MPGPLVRGTWCDLIGWTNRGPRTTRVACVRTSCLRCRHKQIGLVAGGGGATPLISARRTRVPVAPPKGTGTGGPGAPARARGGAIVVRYTVPIRFVGGVHGELARAYRRTGVYVRARLSCVRASIRLTRPARRARDGQVGRTSHRAWHGTVRATRARARGRPHYYTIPHGSAKICVGDGPRDFVLSPPGEEGTTHEAVQTYSPWCDGGGPSGGRPGSGSMVSCREGAPSVPWPSDHVRNICRSSEHSSGVSA